MKTVGTIYIINCGDVGSYVGMTRLHPSERQKRHFAFLRRRKHSNHRMQRLWDKYGPAAFSFNVLEQTSACPITELRVLLPKREAYWCAKLSREPGEYEG